MNIAQNKQKSKGPIRFEAIIPFTIIILLVGMYFTLFFDAHLKKAFELIGYNVVGAEVNISKVHISFIKGTFRVSGIQITDAEQPTHNSIQIGDIRFGVLWDGLLRAKFVVSEMAVEQIAVNTKRKYPGKVKPPEPPEPPSTEPSLVEKEAEKWKQKALSKAKDEYSGNVLGDIANILGGVDPSEQMKSIESALPSKAKAQELDKAFKEKQSAWNEKIKSLPQAKEFQSLGDRLSKVKTKDFKTPQELQESLREIESVFKEADEKIKTLQIASNELNSDSNKLTQDLKELENMIQKDIKDLEARFKLPKLDANTLTRAVFNHYAGPYLSKINRYQSMAKKYIPPNLLNKKNTDQEREISIQAKPRGNGTNYEFGKPNSYPAFWIKKILVSSKADPTTGAGDLTGTISDISSNQLLNGKPTVANLKGDFPSSEIFGFSTSLTIDNRKALSDIIFDLQISDYAINSKELVKSDEVNISFNKARGSTKAKGELTGLKLLNLNLVNEFKKIDYQVSAKNNELQDILKNTFSEMPTINLVANGEGVLPDVPIDIKSNFGGELQKGLEKQINAKIEVAKAKIRAFVDEQTGKEKAKIEEQIKNLKSQIDGEIKKLQEAANSQKSQADAKTAQTKKEAEIQANKAKKDIEDKLKKQLGDDGQKKLDELKKKLSF